MYGAKTTNLNSAGFLGALFYVYSIATFDVGAALLAKCAPLPTLLTRAILVIRTGARPLCLMILLRGHRFRRRRAKISQKSGDRKGNDCDGVHNCVPHNRSLHFSNGARSCECQPIGRRSSWRPLNSSSSSASSRRREPQQNLQPKAASACSGRGRRPGAVGRPEVERGGRLRFHLL